ncbi:MAG: TetR/AcrR family transcriptional regulator [candidate division Zixibacteria bacterium]|nr:TetR/AcrR family transcriptional regulator [candidate division Zixibacteria bacterium]
MNLETTVTRILQAAAALFVAKNYADVTVSQIADSAGVTKGALYHHFRSKEELYLAMMHAELEEKRLLFSEAVAPKASCPERLGHLLRAFLKLPRDQREVMRLVRRDINIFRAHARADLIVAYQAALPMVAERVIQDGIHDGELAAGDARLLSWQFVALAEVALSRYADSRFTNADQRVAFVLDLFFHGAAAQHGVAIS